MGSYPQSLNILDHNINRAEYIQLFSLLSNAAEKTPMNQSCVRLNTYGDIDDPGFGGGFDNTGQQGGYEFRPEEPVEKTPRTESSESGRKEPKRQRTRSWIDRARDQLNKIIKEPEEDGDENF